MKPSTKPPAADRAILCQRGSELAEFEPLLAELGMSVEIVRGDLPSADAVAGARIVIVAGQRLAEGRPPAVRSWPRTLAVVDDGSRTLAAHLNRIGVAMILRRPIHPRALRLLLIHELYRGPERRGRKRVLIGHPIRAGSGLFKHGATLLELSRTGARLSLAHPPRIGSLIQFVLGKELTNAKPIKVQARVVRSIENGQGGRAGEREIGVALLDPASLAKPIQAILDRFALGPATTGSGLRPAANSGRSGAARASDRAQPALPLTHQPANQPTQKPASQTPPPTPANASATNASARPSESSAADPDAPRRLPPSYQPKSAPAPIDPAPAIIASTQPAGAIPDDVPDALELGFTETAIEVLETDFDLELELDDEIHPETGPRDASASASSNDGERRRSARVAYDQRVVALDEQAARVVVGRDLCLGGMRIEANPELAVGDVLRIALHAGSDTQPLVVLAGVERDDGEDGLVLAFASLSVPQRERLEKILAASGTIEDADDTDAEGGDSLVVGELLARVARRPETRPSASGFTLVELMIVVAIIGLLASTAVPVFARYQLRAKSAEAVANLGAIRVVQEAYSTEHGIYLAANAEPPLIPGPSAVPFDIAGTAYAQMGWSPDGRVYFSYAVATSADQTGYTADAAADIDGNGILQIWGYVKPDPDGTTTVGQLGCDPALIPAEHVGICTGGSPAF
ncbi:MAG: PilZ domain-containing protein [Myxococcota bacterium]